MGSRASSPEPLCHAWGRRRIQSRCLSAGIVSALAFAPDVSSDVYAAGSFSPSSPSSSNIAIFSEGNGEVPIMFVGAEDQPAGGGAGYGVRASVSQVSPQRPHAIRVRD